MSQVRMSDSLPVSGAVSIGSPLQIVAGPPVVWRKIRLGLLTLPKSCGAATEAVGG